MSYNDKDLAARVISLLLDPNTLAANWGVYLFDAAFDKEVELRRKICVIWLCALMDCVEAEERELENYIAEASSRGYRNMIRCCQRVRQFYETVRALLETFTKEDQLFLQDSRDQLVHGWLNKRHLNEFTVKWVEGAAIRRERMSCDQFRDSVRFGYETDLTGVVLARFLDQSHPYWREATEMVQPGFSSSIMKAVYSDIGIEHGG